MYLRSVTSSPNFTILHIITECAARVQADITGLSTDIIDLNQVFTLPLRSSWDEQLCSGLPLISKPEQRLISSEICMGASHVR